MNQFQQLRSSSVRINTSHGSGDWSGVDLGVQVESDSLQPVT